MRDREVFLNSLASSMIKFFCKITPKADKPAGGGQDSWKRAHNEKTGIIY
jgi:hypothetical protein